MLTRPDIEGILQRLLAEGLTNEDRQQAVDEIFAGNLVLSTGTGSVAVGGNLANSIILTGTQIHLHLPEEILARFREEVFPKSQGVPPPLPQMLFVGRTTDIKEVGNRLSNGTVSTYGKRITIVRGWPGVGKTTLAAVIGRYPAIARAFPDGILWAAIDENPRPMDILAEWERALGGSSVRQVATLAEAVDKVRRLLDGKQVLLILDDVWKVEDALQLLPVAGDLCSVLITTRKTKVADDLDPNGQATYVLDILGEQDALQLLSLIAPLVVEAERDECRRLVQTLECLPLALHVAGRLLAVGQRRGWNVTQLIDEISTTAVLLEADAPIDRGDGERIPTVLALLQKSTDKLSEEEREHFAELGAFPSKPATFDIEAIKAVWNVDDPVPFLNVLMDHGLLEHIGSQRYQMHALLVQHAEGLFKDDENEEQVLNETVA